MTTADLAMPDPSVSAVFTPPAKVAAAPLPGTAYVTVTPVTGLPLESFTVASKGSANEVFTAAVCGVPPVAVMDAADPPAPGTTTVAVTSGIYGGAEAWITAVPGLTPETTTTMVVMLLPSG